MIQPFPSTMELFTNAGRNRVDVMMLVEHASRTSSSSYSIQKIARNLFLYPYSKMYIRNRVLKFTRKMEMNSLQCCCLFR